MSAFASAFDSGFGATAVDNRADLIARVTARVHAQAGDAARVALAVDAAIDYVDTFNGIDSASSTSPMVNAGLEGFATRLYLDAGAPFGGIGSVGDVDGTFGVTPSPEDVYRHWHHYFDLHATSWGIA